MMKNLEENLVHISVIEALNEALKKERSQNAALMLALEGIKSEFKRQKSEAKSFLDAIYLDGVLAVIEANSFAVMEANKKLHSKENQIQDNPCPLCVRGCHDHEGPMICSGRCENGDNK